jgi:hypothetical protein
MMVGRKSSVLLILVAVLAILTLQFQNCGQMVNFGKMESSAQSMSKPLRLIIPQPTIETGKSLQLSAEDGTPPYEFWLISGGASVDKQGLFIAGSSASTVEVTVADSAGNEAHGSVEITLPVVTSPTPTPLPPPPPPPPRDCVSPWGATVPHGTSVKAYKRSLAVCGSTTCEYEMRQCSDGVLSGSAANRTCTMGSCEATFNVNRSDGCIRGYCACHQSNVINTCIQSQADEVCHQMGFVRATQFNCIPGTAGQTQCTGGGTGCFVNAGPGNYICENVTCTKAH